MSAKLKFNYDFQVLMNLVTTVVTTTTHHDKLLEVFELTLNK